MANSALEDARAFAKSSESNPHNLESLWYGFWTRALLDVISAGGLLNVLHVAPKYSLWRILEDRNVIIEIDHSREGDFGVEDPADDADALADTTSSSTGEIITASMTRSRITDFALALWQTSSDSSSHTLDIEDELIVALVEIKRAKGEQDKINEDMLLFLAQEAVFEQALYLFANKHRHQNRVLLIAATGDVWTYTVATRMASGDGDPDDSEWIPHREREYFKASPWSEQATWGTAEDSEHRNRVVEWIRAISSA